jgi:hypothetical protein
MQPQLQPDETTCSASKDGVGAGDHDLPYLFGRKPSSLAPYPFSTREFARLLIARSRVQASEVPADDRLS